MSAIEVIEPATEQVMAELPARGRCRGGRGSGPGEGGLSSLAGSGARRPRGTDARVADAIEAHAGELAELEARNAGKPISDARGRSSTVVVETFRYYAGAPERLLGKTIPVAGGVDMTFREPLGVVGLITPWNFPLVIASGRSRRRWPPATRSC